MAVHDQNRERGEPLGASVLLAPLASPPMPSSSEPTTSTSSEPTSSPSPRDATGADHRDGGVRGGA
jgi:hypothetical protein